MTTYIFQPDGGLKRLLGFCPLVASAAGQCLYGTVRIWMVSLLVGLSCSLAQAGSFRSLGVKEGLSSRQVFQIEQDASGFIWAYTHLGVDRYDGNEIKHYKLLDAMDSREHIFSSTTMTCDKAGRIWLSLRNGKIYAYDRQTDAFQLRIDLSDHHASPLLYNLLFDEDNVLWLCLSDGLYTWSDETGLVQVGLPGQCVNCILQSTDHAFFVGTSAGVYQLMRTDSSTVWTEKQLPLPGDVHVESLYMQGDKLFIGTFSDGVFVWEQSVERLHALSGFIPHVPISVFAETKDGALLIGVDGAGMFRVDTSTETLLEHYTTDEDDDRSLNGNTVSDICVDGHGGVWVSTSTNGIGYLDLNLPDLYRIKHEQNNANSLRSDHINVVFQDSEGDCWYGTNRGISRYQPQQRTWTHYLDGTGREAKVVLALAEDARGNIWVGGYGIGIYCIDKKTGQVQKMEMRNTHSDRGAGTDYVYAIYAEGDYIWLGGIEGDFTRYNMRTDTYTYYPIRCIGDIKPGKEGTLLLAGCDGLALFDKETGAVQWQQRFGDFTLYYPVRCLLPSASGELWLATGEGLVRFQPDKKQARVYTTADGLESNSINSLLEDKKGRIWFNTEKELYCLDLAKDVIVNANDFLDITWGYYNSNAACRLADGNLMFGTAEGALVFSSSLDWGRYGPIRLLLTDFKLLYESVKAGEEGSLLKDNIDDTREVSLRYNQNSFSIAFSAINFTAPHRIRYAYRLAGHNEPWEYTNRVGSVNYTNLSPGTYRFQLRAFDKYTGLQLGERQLEVVIHRPFWVSWWALLLYFVLLTVFVYLFVQNRRHKANEDRIKDKIRSFISIAHDIRTPVTLIKAPLSELEAQQGLPEESKKTVAVAVRNVEKLLSMITQLLDLQKTELHAEECLKVSLYDSQAYLEEKMAEFHLATLQKGVGLQLEVAPDMPHVWMDRKKMDPIIDNLLSNALKYTEKGAIYIRVTHSKKKWTLEVTDTGIGIPREEQRNIFHEFYRAQNAMNYEETGSGIGLMITRRMVQQHQGDISFSSEEGKGTTFRVTFPLQFKASVVMEPKESPATGTVTPDAVREEAEQCGKNVLLLAEDDPDMREYLTNSLSSEYQVIGVTDGGKALEMARELNPDIIISDIVMPVLEGDELCRILKSSVDTSHIPVILLTALSERENIIFGLEAGANDYIIKPFDLSVLKVRIRNILQSRQHLRDRVLAMDAQPEETDYASQLDKEFLDKVMEVVQGELSNSEFSINDFCRMLGMSRTSVYNKMKTLTGQGPNDFIRIVRLNKSKELLLSRRYSIAEVSTMVGFADPKYFSTCFKKQFGISPSKI